jgi:hypothetical protein
VALVEALREWVEGDVRDATSGRLQFHTRVAANVMGMLERELVAGPAIAAAHAERLAALGVASERELADRIRAGEGAERDRRLLDAVWQTTVDKLAIANPRHF